MQFNSLFIIHVKALAAKANEMSSILLANSDYFSGAGARHDHHHDKEQPVGRHPLTSNHSSHLAHTRINRNLREGKFRVFDTTVVLGTSGKSSRWVFFKKLSVRDTRLGSEVYDRKPSLLQTKCRDKIQPSDQFPPLVRKPKFYDLQQKIGIVFFRVWAQEGHPSSFVISWCCMKPI